MQRHLGRIDTYVSECVVGFWSAPAADRAPARKGLLPKWDVRSPMNGLQSQLCSCTKPERRMTRAHFFEAH